MPENDFEHSVFINCPFDREYAYLLQAILFCLVYLGFTPRLASERIDGADIRLDRIRALIENSKYSIHDLSRCRSTNIGEFYRLNMPFELGVDYGFRQFSNGAGRQKKILILEEEKYRYQAALSDLAGCDIEAHGGQFDVAMRKVRNWLSSEANIHLVGSAKITGAYIDFQEWNFERQIEAGFSEEDIKDYPTSELLEAMKEWVNLGGPI